jgi:predicted aspartyl protease
MVRYRRELRQMDNYDTDCLSADFTSNESHGIMTMLFQALYMFGLMVLTACVGMSNLVPAEGAESSIYKDKSEFKNQYILAVGSSNEVILKSDFSVPFKVKHRHIVISGLVNEQKATFAIDTGATPTALNGIFASDAHIVASGKSFKTIGLISNTKEKYGIVDTVEIGEMRLNHVPMLIPEHSRPSFSVYLGMDVLKKFVLTINFEESLITFSTNNTTAPADSFTLSLLPDNRPSVMGTLINGEKKVNERFLIDTGSDHNILLASSLNLGTPKPVDINATDVNYRKMKLSVMPLDSFKLPGFEMKNPEVLVLRNSNAETKNLIGLKFLEQFPMVIFDFPNKTLTCVRKKAGAV